MSIAIKDIDLNVLNMKARMPFRYGIASLVAVPHLFVRVTAETGGRREVGLAADGLPPKWFTKNPEASFEDDLEEMLAVIRQACRLALAAGAAETVYEFWREIYNGQEEWAASGAYPPLLWGFGVSLVERALIDAFCRATGATFEGALRENAFGIRLGEIHHDLNGVDPAALLPERASRSILARHTVGVNRSPDRRGYPGGRTCGRRAAAISRSQYTDVRSDAFEDQNCAAIAAQDADRLKHIAGLMERYSGSDYAFTLDGNEQYTEIDPFRALWEAVTADPSLDRFIGRLLFVEQPLRRDVALGEGVGAALRDWSGRPPMIIDESDGTLTSAAQALELGYAGTSHKNCKGIFKGVASACLIADRRQKDPGRKYVLSSEDLECRTRCAAAGPGGGGMSGGGPYGAQRPSLFHGAEHVSSRRTVDGSPASRHALPASRSGVSNVEREGRTAEYRQRRGCAIRVRLRSGYHEVYAAGGLVGGISGTLRILGRRAPRAPLTAIGWGTRVQLGPFAAHKLECRRIPVFPEDRFGTNRLECGP